VSSLTFLVTVTIRLPHGSACTVIATKRPYLPNATETQRHKRCALLQRRSAPRTHSCYLHEEEKREPPLSLNIVSFNNNGIKQLDSVFRVLEPVIDNINERSNPPAGLASRLGFRAPRSEWFRIYRVRSMLIPVYLSLKIQSYVRISSCLPSLSISYSSRLRLPSSAQKVSKSWI
jgi:hypothetical protein